MPKILIKINAQYIPVLYPQIVWMDRSLGGGAGNMPKTEAFPHADRRNSKHKIRIYQLLKT